MFFPIGYPAVPANAMPTVVVREDDYEEFPSGDPLPELPARKYVKVGRYLKRIAIIEISTGSALQYVVGEGRNPQQIAFLCDKLADGWEDYFTSIAKKNVDSERVSVVI